MGLFKKLGRFFKGSGRETETNLESVDLDEYDIGEEAELSHHLSQIVDATFEMEDLKREYQLVTSYFSDIQKIEQMSPAMRSQIEDDTRKILMLEDNRKTFQQQTARLHPDVYALMSRREEEVPEGIEKLSDLEDMRSKIRRDLEYLEGEKGSIEYHMEQDQSTMGKLRAIAIIIGILIVLVIGFFFLLQSQTGDSYATYWVIATFVGITSELIIFLVYNSKAAEIRKNAMMKNRAISLQNKVKIKWLNNINTLDFLYAKFEVNSAKELSYNWEQYRLMVEEEKQYQKNTGDLHVYQEEFVATLRKAGVWDTELWLSQMQALIDPREMVEVKHTLNTRRQKLREQMQVKE